MHAPILCNVMLTRSDLSTFSTFPFLILLRLSQFYLFTDSSNKSFLSSQHAYHMDVIYLAFEGKKSGLASNSSNRVKAAAATTTTTTVWKNLPGFFYNDSLSLFSRLCGKNQKFCFVLVWRLIFLSNLSRALFVKVRTQARANNGSQTLRRRKTALSSSRLKFLNFLKFLIICGDYIFFQNITLTSEWSENQ